MIGPSARTMNLVRTDAELRLTLGEQLYLHETKQRGDWSALTDDERDGWAWRAVWEVKKHCDASPDEPEPPEPGSDMLAAA